MKALKFIKVMLVAALMFMINLNVNAGTPGDNLVRNAEEVNGVIVSETVYKMNNGILSNYMKYNYKYNENNLRSEEETQKWDAENNTWINNVTIHYTYDNKTIKAEYYKWNAKKNQYILIPNMTVIMDR